MRLKRCLKSAPTCLHASKGSSLAVPFVLCINSVAFRSVSCCEDELDDIRSLQLKSLLSEYFDKRREGDRAPAPEDYEGFDKYKVDPLCGAYQRFPLPQ